MSFVVLCSISAVLAVGAPPSPPSSSSSSQAALDAHREGMRLKKANKVPEAIEQLEKAVKLDPTLADAWADLGDTSLSAGAMDAAIRAFQQAVKLREDFQIARYNLAYALRKTNAHAKAAEQYRVYLQRDPEDADAWYGLAESLRLAGEGGAAAEAYERYAKVEKRPAQQRWVKKAEEQAKQLRVAFPAKAGAASQEVAREPVKETPAAAATTVAGAGTTGSGGTGGTKHVSFSARGGSGAKKDDAPSKETAKESATNASAKETAKEQQVSASPKRPAAFDEGIAALKAGDFDAALSRLEAALKVMPEDSMVLAALGSAHLGLREGRDAERAYRRALEGAKPEAAPGIWLGIGEAMRMMGESAKALEAFEHVAKDEVASAALKAAAAERAAALR